MDLERLQHLAGVPSEHLLTEDVEFGEHPTVEQVIFQLEAAKKALGIVNTIRNPEERQKHLRRVFVGMNKIRSMLAKLSNVADE